MSGIVSVHVGGCGNSVGEAFYNVISHEHGLTPHGQYIGNRLVQLQRLGVYYTLGRTIYAKAVCVDTDHSTFDQNTICSPYRNMFAPQNQITDQGHGTGNNFAKGYRTEGKRLLHRTMEAIRREAEGSDAVQGLQLCHSIGGGTGAGFTSLLLEHLANDYASKLIFSYTIIPSWRSPVGVVEPYNALLGFRHLSANTNLALMIDNDALQGINLNLLHRVSFDKRDTNHLIAHTMAGITSCLRFSGQLNSSLRKIYTNTVPFPNLHFVAPGFAPLVSDRGAAYTKLTVQNLVYQMLCGRNLLCSADLRRGKHMTLAAIFRGHISPLDIEGSIITAMGGSDNRYVDWIPNHCHWAICDVAPKLMPKSVSFLCNTTAMYEPIRRLQKSAARMLKKQAYLHWFTAEGMEESDFTQAYDNISDLLTQYDEAESIFPTRTEREYYEKQEKRDEASNIEKKRRYRTSN